jgi:hypothetical protein
MSRWVKVTFTWSLHATHTHPQCTHIWIATRVIDPYQPRTTYIYRTNQPDALGRVVRTKDRGRNHKKKGT